MNKKQPPPKKMTEKEKFKQTEKNRRAIRGNTAVCSNCGIVFEQTDLGILSDAIMRAKPACSYECNKALGQTK